MLSFLKKIFGSNNTPAETAAPYKVEATKVNVDEFPFPKTKPAKAVAKAKKSVVAKTTRTKKAK